MFSKAVLYDKYFEIFRMTNISAFYYQKSVFHCLLLIDISAMKILNIFLFSGMAVTFVVAVYLALFLYY